MSPETRPKERLIGRVFENWLIPATFGVVTMCVVVQLLSFIPGVRPVMDRLEGRFTVIPTSAAPALQKMSAIVTLSVDDVPAAAHVQVELNRQSLGTFTSNQMTVTVHQGDSISFLDPDGTSVSISVDTNDPHLFMPMAGQVVQLGQGQTEAQLAAAEFI